jgi:hypothetical protein
MLSLFTWLLFFPLMFGLWVIFGLLMLPFLLLRVVFKVFALVLFLPLVLLLCVVGLVVAGVAVTAALLVPLIPFALAALLLWLILRAASPRTA